MNKKQLLCFYTNANSMRNKQNELLGRVEKLHPDMGVTEVWMKEDDMLPGYHVPFRFDRAQDNKGR